MLTNYFKIAWRHLFRNKTFSAVNILGLALGITCSMLIMFWVQDERAVDGFHANDKQLFQVYERQYHDGTIDAAYHTQGLLAEELKRAFPEIQFASSLDYAAPPGTTSVFEAGDKIAKMEGSYAGADFFKMFSYPLVQGTPEAALNSPEAIAISRKMAEYFFGGAEKAIGQMMRYQNNEDLLVTAVFENLPGNTSRKFDFLKSWSAYVKENAWVNNWGNTSPVSYIQLRTEADPTKVEAKIKDFIYRFHPKDPASNTELALQPYSEVYLHSSFKNGFVDGGRIEYVNLFTLVAVFILLIACINFMNLATARAAKRAKEVGLRKVIGAGRSSLIFQFIGEAMVLTACSIVLAMMLTSLLLPIFNALTGKELAIPFSQPSFWVAIILMLIATGLTAGSYPAIFLSSLKPVRVLKGSLKFNWRSTFFRQGLVVFQFSLSIIFIVGMIVIYRQMDYIQTKNLGYSRDNLLYLPIEGDLIKNYPLFKEKAGKLPGVLAISKMRNSPTVIQHHTGSISWPGKDPNYRLSFADGVVGYDFVKTMKLSILEGRDFSKDYGTDSASFIVNETAVKKMGYDNAVGKPLTWGNREGRIIAVLKDFHFNSMHEKIDPLVLRLDEKWGWGTILVRIDGSKTKETIAAIEKVSREMNPKFPFTHQFSDTEYARLYQSEQVVSKLANYFALLAIFISCLGLFGLAAFTAAQRTKEIGVRKVLGASVPNIIGMLSNNFLKLVAIAMLVAFPVSWVAMNKWLQGFAYKIDIEWWMFALAGGATICIALLTVSYQSIKAALVNPVKSLRTE